MSFSNIFYTYFIYISHSTLRDGHAPRTRWRWRLLSIVTLDFLRMTLFLFLSLNNTTSAHDFVYVVNSKCTRVVFFFTIRIRAFSYGRVDSLESFLNRVSCSGCLLSLHRVSHENNWSSRRPLCIKPSATFHSLRVERVRWSHTHTRQTSSAGTSRPRRRVISRTHESRFSGKPDWLVTSLIRYDAWAHDIVINPVDCSHDPLDA